MKRSSNRDASQRSEAHESFASREVTILLADLRAFTSLSADHPAGVVLELLNQCFLRMSEIIARHQGTIDKFMSDSLLVIFFSRPGKNGADHVRRALRCAVDMQISMEALNAHNAQLGLPPVYMGIGLNTGEVMAGLVGSKRYSAFTVIGEEVSLASRIEAFTLRGQVLASEATFERSAGYVAAGDPMDVYVKGKPERVRLREVLGIPSLRKSVPRQEIRRSPRVDVNLPFTYRRVQGENVVSETLAGTILDLGYHGVLAELARELPLYTELRLDLELPLVAHRGVGLQARIVKVAPRDGAFRAGLEFTSLPPETNAKLQLFVQRLIQGDGAKTGIGGVPQNRGRLPISSSDGSGHAAQGKSVNVPEFHMPSAEGSQSASAGKARSAATRMKSAARKGSVPR